MVAFIGTPGTDLPTYNGTVQQVTLTLVNPYSSKSYDIDDEFRVTSDSYDMLGGYDILNLSNNGDFLSITDNTGMQVLANVELIVAGDGGDVINLAHSTLTYIDVIIAGGTGDDILWGNVGDDQIYGSYGNDIIDGGPGDDLLYGNDDNDQVFGGAGDDRLEGGAGDDILFGGTDLGLIGLDKNFDETVTFPELKSGRNIKDLLPPGTPAQGINGDNLSVSFDATATLTFREGFAGYNNTLGMYNIAEDGTIQMASMLWTNVKDAGVDNAYSIDLPVGENSGQFGFFIIANGDRVNKGYHDMDHINDQDVIRFVYDYGGTGERAATVHDDGNMVSIVYDDGTTTEVLKGPAYHTTPRGDDTPDINWDGEIHALSGLLEGGSQDVLRIGFEDLPNLGDADFEDVLFDLDIDRIHIDASEVGNDVLIGGAGNDVLYGEAGDDILVIGDGFDQATGGSGVDQFVFDAFDGLADKILDFNSAEEDVLNISDILVGYDPLTNMLTDFVRLVQNGGDTELHVDADGTAGGINFTALAVFEGGIADTMTDLINNGNLVADSPVVL